MAHAPEGSNRAFLGLYQLSKANRIVGALILAAALALVAFAPQAHAADLAAASGDTVELALMQPQARAVKLNANKVQLYGVDPDIKDKTGEIPASKPTSFQLEVTGGMDPVYRVTSGQSVDVDEYGLVTPHYTTWYWSGGMGTTAKPADMTGVTVDTSLDSGTSTITVYTDNGSATVDVTVVDYGVEVFEAALDEYVKENVKSGMSVREKVEVACKYPASFPYKTSASSAYGMFYNDGGDCWASTDMIVKLCKRMGLDAWSRNGNKDGGAGSGHMNAIVDGGNGVYYIAEAGYYSTEVPRGYTVTEKTTLWSYRLNSDGDGIELYQYDGKEYPKALVIPESVEGHTVTSLGRTCLYNGTFTSVQIPSTVTSIDQFAFSGCSNLKSLVIGPNVTSIGASAFCECTSLDLTVSPANPNYTAIGGVLYDKGVTKLLAVFKGSTVDIPDTVTEIGEGAFYSNSGIQEITIPASVRTIDDYAFVRTGITKYYFKPKTAPEVAENAFDSFTQDCEIHIPLRSSGYDVAPWTDARIVKPVMADATVTLSADAFAYDGKAKTPQVKTVILDGETLVSGTDYVVSGYKDNVNAGTGKVVLTGRGDVKGTYEVPFTIAPIDISTATCTMDKAARVFTGKQIKPAISSVKLGKTALVAGKDFKLEYSNNVNAGTGKVSIVGVGNYTGTVSATFAIAKAKNPMNVKAKAPKVKAGKTIKMRKAFAVSKAKGTLTFAKKSGNKKISVAKNGKITVAKNLKKKTYKIKVKVKASGNANYKRITKTVVLKVTVK